ISIVSPLRSTVRARPIATLRAPSTARTTASGGGGTRCCLRLPLGASAGDLAVIDPHLHADPPERGARLVETVVDVGTQRVQRNPALPVELRPGHFRSAEPARALTPDPLRATAHRRLHRLAHRPTELHAARELFGHPLGNQLGIGLGVLDLQDVELNLLPGQLLQVTPHPLRLGTAAADDDARTSSVDVHPHPVTGPLDLDLADAGPLHALGQHPADLYILADIALVELVRVPPALMVGRDTEPEPVRV